VCQCGQVRAPEPATRGGLQDCRILAEEVTPLGADFGTAGAAVHRFSAAQSMSPFWPVAGGGQGLGEIDRAEISDNGFRVAAACQSTFRWTLQSLDADAMAPTIPR
jgi:hypothetical protein